MTGYWRGMICGAALAVLAGCQHVTPGAEPSAPKVGATTRAGAGLSEGGGWFTVDKTDILTPRRGGETAADVDAAIAHYDSVLKLQAAPELRAEAMRRAAYLRIRRFVDSGNNDEADLHAALRLYDGLLEEMPDAPGNDLARYQKARALDLLGRRADAARALVALTERHSESALYADAAFRAGEMFYSEDLLAEAAEAYERLLAVRPEVESLYELAAYKLGWTQLRAGRHGEAAEVFLAILERLLPESGCANGCPEAVLDDEGFEGPHREIAEDALRGFSRALIALGGAETLRGRDLSPEGAPLYYWATAEALLERQRYSDAANAFAAFAQRFPRHELAPRFQVRVVEAYEDGDFGTLAGEARATFVTTYHPETGYWEGREPPEWIDPTLREQLDLLATDQHAHAQSLAESEVAEREGAHRLAAHWYDKWLALLAEGPERTAVRMRHADALLDAGASEEAIRQFSRVAYDSPEAAEAPAAALAVVQTRFRLAREAPESVRDAEQRKAIAAARQLAERFSGHPERARVLVRAAEASLALTEYQPAIDMTDAVLAEAAPATELWRVAMHVRADCHFARDAFELAEVAYRELLEQMPSRDPQRPAVTHQLGAVIYRQGEQAREAGEFRQAAAHFLRIGTVVPNAPQRPEADYDAAAAIVKADDWAQAADLFEAFVGRYPDHELVPDADKWLATAYGELGTPRKAAEVYLRIGQRRTESAEVRREAVWQAATLFDEAEARRSAAEGYRAYLQDFGVPLDRAQRARLRLAALAGGEDGVEWLRAVRRAHREAGAAASAYSELAAARAALMLGTALADRAGSVRLSYPLRASLQRRQPLTREALEHLRAARASGFDELVTEAAYRLGAVHATLARDLRNAQHPPGLDDFERDAYELMLEDEAFPFEERAIAEHERNLEYLREGVWDEWIMSSGRALAEMAPGRYARRERQEEMYAEID
jgi:TolA-binding protein